MREPRPRLGVDAFLLIVAVTVGMASLIVLLWELWEIIAGPLI
jgi:hypothetical protein